jgi:hypothetical protein
MPNPVEGSRLPTASVRPVTRYPVIPPKAGIHDQRWGWGPRPGVAIHPDSV